MSNGNGQRRMVKNNMLLCLEGYIQRWHSGEYAVISLIDLVGRWLNLVQTNVAASGTADSFLKASHLTKTRYAHQVTAVTLSKLLVDAFLECNGNEVFDEEEFKVWHHEMLWKIPTYQFCDIFLRLQLMILIFVKAHWENNFALYVEILEVHNCTLVFAFDHMNTHAGFPFT